MSSDVDREWALSIFRQSLRSARLTLSPSEVASSSESPAVPLDPDQLDYLRELIQHVLEGRKIIATYSLALLAFLVLFSLHHFWSRRCEKIGRRLIEGEADNRGVPGTHNDVEDDQDDPESSSSSTLSGTPSSNSNLKKTDCDLERQPLLKNVQSAIYRPTYFALFRSWLTYQPRPIPMINRALPSNGSSLFVTAYIALNVFFHLYRLPFEAKHFFVFADRAGLMFVVNMPLLYLLAAKNQPLKLLTGRSYEALNIYHRRVGEWMCFEAFLHFAGILVWRSWIAPEWLMMGSFWHFITRPLILLGLGALVSYELLYFTSLGSFRERWYELFLASHVFLQTAALVFLWLHFPTSRPYVYASLAIFTLDRIVWRILIKSTTTTAKVSVLEDGETVWLSTTLEDPFKQRRNKIWHLYQSVLRGWHPADHVFITVPVLGGSNVIQAHPFTIASAAPRPDDIKLTTPQLDLLIRAQSGFSGELLQYARANSTVRVRLDGPYGSQDPLDMLRASTNAVLIAGGSGIAVVFPLIWDLAMVHRGKRKVHLLWILHSRSQRSWMPADRLHELRRAGVRITIPEPTAEVGRPDVSAYVADVVAASRTGTGVVVSGPDGLNRSVRNACADEIRSGADISLRVEKFGW